MKICAACGKENTDSAKFCFACGTRFASSAPATPEVSSPSGPTVPISQEPAAEVSPVSPASTVSPVLTVPPTSTVSPVPGVHPTSSAPAGPQPPAFPGVQSSGPQGSSTTPPQPQAIPQPQQQAAPSWTPGPAGPQQYTQIPQQPQAAPAQPSAAAAYFHWLVDSLKTPSKNMATRTWWGYLTNGLVAFFLALTFFLIAARSISQATSGVNGFFQGITGSADSVVSSSMTPTSFILMVLAALIFVAVTVFLVFLSRKIFGETGITFTQVNTQMAQLFVPFLLVYLVTTLLALVTFTPLAVVFVLWSFEFLGFLAPTQFALSHSTRRMDPFWSWVLCILIAGVAYLLVALITALCLGNVLNEIFSSIHIF